MSKSRPSNNTTIRKPEPIGQMRKIVSLLDRGDADEYFYPPDTTNTVFQPEFQPYYNFTQETIELPYTGAANWGQRITFSLPFPSLGDCLSWITLRFSPNSWLPNIVIDYLTRSQPKRWEYTDISGQAWTWTTRLASAALELVEMEVNGIVIEKWSGDWIDIWQKVYLDSSRSSGYEDSISGRINTELNPGINTFINQEQKVFFDNPAGEGTPIDIKTLNNSSLISPTEDGNVYIYLPFWFARRKNAAFPLVSIQGEGNIRFHITFRKFEDVIRRVCGPRKCGETMLGGVIDINNKNSDILETVTFNLPIVPPILKDAVLLCGFIQLESELRNAYIHNKHEVLWDSVINIPFNEPIKYATNTMGGDTITVSLPLDAANGPVREIIWFVRRKAIYKYNSWANYGAYMEDEIDPIFNPQRPLMKKAVLRMGTVVWADQDELWWRQRGALSHVGSSQIMSSYIYAYNFGEDPSKFGPTGSVNASRINIRLDLTIQPPENVMDKEWEVQVYVLAYNWIRFENGIAERLFTD
jgi:hypothetical protein